MREYPQRTIHLGVNFIIAPPPDLSGGAYLDFQRRLAAEKVEFTQAAKPHSQAVFLRQGPASLQVQVGPIPEQPVGQLLIMAAADVQSGAVEAGISAVAFIEEAQTVADVFEEVWGERRQVVARDATLRLLLDSGVDHAFQFLWEHRFGQAEQSLGGFGRPVLGGGLRLVMPNVPREHDELVELKIESFLADPSQIFIDTSMKWPKPIPEGTIDPSGLVDALISFTDERVLPFLSPEE